MGEFTLNTDHIGISIYFELEVIYISNSLPEVKSTCRIYSVETDLVERAKNQEQHTDDLGCKTNTSSGSVLGYLYMEYCKK